MGFKCFEIKNFSRMGNSSEFWDHSHSTRDFEWKIFE